MAGAAPPRLPDLEPAAPIQRRRAVPAARPPAQPAPDQVSSPSYSSYEDVLADSSATSSESDVTPPPAEARIRTQQEQGSTGARGSQDPPPVPRQLFEHAGRVVWILVVGSATDTNWGLGAAATGPALARVPGDQLEGFDYFTGGPLRTLLEELRDPARGRREADAISEALA